ncbi:MAG: MBL fold metallo-hydrolase [Chitinivibrionales bacterium]
MKITFLGTGTSHGVPSIDCMIRGFAHCPKGVCRESADDPRHRRKRCSILIEKNGFVVLIDVSADFRQQMLAARVSRIDAVLITHPHADHIGGLPDIRSYTLEHSLPVYGSQETLTHIQTSFPYIFEPPVIRGGGIPRLTTHAVENPFQLGGLQIVPIPVVHGSLQQSLGYRIGPVAYIPDLKKLKPGSGELLAGVRVLILDSLRTHTAHQTHMILPESIELARRIAPEKCYFTHLCHEIHYLHDARYLDAWMQFAWDGLCITIND